MPCTAVHTHLPALYCRHCPPPYEWCHGIHSYTPGSHRRPGQLAQPAGHRGHARSIKYHQVEQWRLSSGAAPSRSRVAALAVAAAMMRTEYADARSFHRAARIISPALPCSASSAVSSHLCSARGVPTQSWGFRMAGFWSAGARASSSMLGHVR
jgi:hypothetical protein